MSPGFSTLIPLDVWNNISKYKKNWFLFELLIVWINKSIKFFAGDVWGGVK
jgi:hypothetical protein